MLQRQLHLEGTLCWKTTSGRLKGKALSLASAGGSSDSSPTCKPSQISGTILDWGGGWGAPADTATATWLLRGPRGLCSESE